LQLRKLQQTQTQRNSNTPLQWYPTKYKFWPRVLPTPALALEKETQIKTHQSKKERNEIGTNWIYIKEEVRLSKLKRNRDRGKIAYPKARKIKSKKSLYYYCLVLILLIRPRQEYEREEG
jgi:hypothetical protein